MSQYLPLNEFMLKQFTTQTRELKSCANKLSLMYIEKQKKLGSEQVLF